MKNVAKVFLFFTAFVLCFTSCGTPANENNETTNAGTLFVYVGTASSLEIANDSTGYTFPDTFLNESNEVSITLKNTGNDAIRLTSKQYINLDGATTLFSVSVPPESSTISPGMSVSFKIKFTPLNVTESYVYVSIPNNSKNMPDFSFKVYGKGIRPKPVAAILYNGDEIPQNGPINIGEVILTRPQNITVIIKNDGRLVLTIETDNITITGTEKEAFIIKDPPAQNISPGDQSQLIIECNPDKLGGNNATLRIPTNDSSRPQVEVYLQAQAVKGSAVLQIIQGTTVITNNSLTPFDFGPVDLGEDKPLVFTIKNTGNITLELTEDPAVVSSNALFSISTQPAKKTLLPGIPEDTTSFIVKFTPTAEVEETAKITIMNSSDEMIFTLNVKGTGTTKTPQITVSQSSAVINQLGEYDFRTVTPGETKDIIFTIGNSGEANLAFETVNNNRINLENDTGTAFTVIAQPSAITTVAPGSSTTFTIRFNPLTLESNFTAIVTIRTNSRNDEVFSFTVKGSSNESIPAAPAGVTAKALSSSSISVSWNPVSGATSYKVYYGTSSSSITILASSTVTGNSYTHTELQTNTTYYYRVIATNSAGDSSYSSYSYAATKLAAPTGVTAILQTSSNTIRVSWNPVTGVTRYKVYYTTGSQSNTKILADTITGTSFTHSGFGGIPSTTYYYFIVAMDSDSESDYSLNSTGVTIMGYSIGEIGPGGGYIFYKSGNEFKEVVDLPTLASWNSAKTLTANYRGGGFSNWYLPDIGELNLIYNNLHSKNMGNLDDDEYWSSTEYENNPQNAAWYLDLYDGYQGLDVKTSNTQCVCAVRKFTL